MRRPATPIIVSDYRYELHRKIRNGIYRLVVYESSLHVIAKDKEQIRILHVEDDPNDGELISIAIRRRFPKCVINRISSRVEFEQALHRDFDVILSDFKIPNFSGREALELASKRRPEVPLSLERLAKWRQWNL